MSGVDNIKLAIEYLLSLQDKQAMIIDRMDKDLRSRNYIVDKLAKESGDRDKAVKDCQQKIKDLENKSCDHEDRLFGLNTDFESFKMNYQIFIRNMEGFKNKMSEFEDHGERIAKCEREIADLKRDVAKANRPVIQGGDGVDADALADMLDNFKKEMHTMFARREDVESLADRVKKLEEDYTTMDTTLNQTSDLANNNKEEIEKLKKMLAGKLDCDLFDSEIAKLTQAIQNAGGDVSKVESASNTAFGTKDINRIKEMLDKFPDLEKALEALKKRQEQFEKEINEKLDNSVTKISKDLQDLKDLLDQLMRDMDFLKSSGGGSGGGASPDVIIQVTNKIEKLEIKLGNLENELNSMRRAKAQTVTMPPPQTMTAPTVDEGRIDALEKNLSQLDKDFKKFNNEIIKEIKNHQDQINGKADYSQLDELRDHLLSKIDELLRGFKQFADKNETKKALKNLEKQLKNLYDLVMSRLHPGADEDDAMFSKKPLGGFSCAS